MCGEAFGTGRSKNRRLRTHFGTVDLPEMLAKVLREYVEAKSGYLFSTRQGKPLLTENVRRALRQAAGPKVGFHVFRRLRAAVLPKARIPKDLIKIWLGHARNLTDRYAAQFQDDVAYRHEWAERADLGFDVCDTCDTKSQLEAENEKPV